MVREVMLFLQDSETHYVKRKKLPCWKKQTNKQNPNDWVIYFQVWKVWLGFPAKESRPFFFFPDLLLSLSSIQETLQYNIIAIVLSYLIMHISEYTHVFVHIYTRRYRYYPDRWLKVIYELCMWFKKCIVCGRDEKNTFEVWMNNIILICLS